MAPRPSRNAISDPCTVASPSRRALHLVIALAGWALFFYWWAVVLRRVNHEMVVFTVTFIAVTMLVSVALTVGWALHNRRIFERRGPRTELRMVAEDYARDVLGRTLRFEPKLGAIRHAPLVRIRIDGGVKAYAPAGPAGVAEGESEVAAS